MALYDTFDKHLHDDVVYSMRREAKKYLHSKARPPLTEHKIFWYDEMSCNNE